MTRRKVMERRRFPLVQRFAAGGLLLLALWPSPVSAQGFGECACPPAMPGLVHYSGPVLPAPQTVTAASVRPVEGNLLVEISEDFANRIVSRQNRHEGPVQDFVLGANVYGDQQTHTETRIDFVPDDHQARWTYTLSGWIDNRTVGMTPQAAVQTEGRHHMRIVKEIGFDGTAFNTRSPAAFITPSLRHVGAVTQASGVPIIGPISGNIAMRAAEMRRPTAERVAAYKVTEGAAPEFNNRIDAELSRLNQSLNNVVRPSLEKWNLVPDQQQFRTTDDTLLWQVELQDPGAHRSPGVPSHHAGRGKAATLAIHESLLNAAIHRQSIAGLELTTAEISQRLKTLPGQNPATADESTMLPPATIRFADDHPIVLRFDNQHVEIVVKMGIQTAIGPSLPVQEVVIPFTVELTSNSVRLQPGDVTIQHADPQTAASALDEVARQLIRTELQRRLTEVTLMREFSLPLEGEQDVSVRVRDIVMANGWLTVSFD